MSFNIISTSYVEITVCKQNWKVAVEGALFFKKKHVHDLTVISVMINNKST